MTLWPRHNWTLIRGQRRSTPQGTGWCAIKHATAAWKVPLKESSLPEPSSVTLRVILWTPSGPCAPWGASGPATTSPGPPSPSSSSSPGLTPLLPSLQTKSTRSIGPGSCDSQDAQDVHQRPQRLGNKEVLETSSRFLMIPATAQRCWWETECRQWDTDKLRRVETGTSQYDLRKIISLLCKDQKVTREKQLGGLEEGHEETAEVQARRPASSTSRPSPAAPTSTTSSSRAAAVLLKTGSSGSRETRVRVCRWTSWLV